MAPATFRAVGILSRLGGWTVGPTAPLAQAAAYGSPLTAEDLAASDSVVAAAFGLSPNGAHTVTREQAMTIPAVKRGRQVICATIASQPLVALRGGQLDRVARPLLEQPNPNTTRQHVIAWTVDDLLFRGLSWWLITDRDSTGFPTAAQRLAPHRVAVDLTDEKVRVDGKPMDDSRLIRFDGPDEGVLAYSQSLNTALLLEAAVRRNADGLPPLDLFTLAEGAAEMTPDEIAEFLDTWQDARRDRSSGFVNRAVVHTSVGFDAQAAGLAEARRFQIGEVARLMNLPPRYVDAEAGSSMTYSNVQSERLELVDLSLSPYITALEQRLSMPDVTPRGQAVRVDLSGFLRGDTKTALEAGQLAVTIGAATPDEVRADVYSRPPLDRPAPAPAAQPTAPEATR